ncbi:hypothetical protein NEIELOOT_01901 [Neisseria elongata subsp. glycolytica ATCC 29315]|uniref:Uncharacterized protein n=1 Tax=Neisseria elongata subsp. glycolytica ATCC 29315 TaxID=546263 RepID=D4DS57_NEIEG|nr:hypothetical protein NEIELOOT_01901 [Neisseria elongata subsp. glycolytica ATCC 29315]
MGVFITISRKRPSEKRKRAFYTKPLPRLNAFHAVYQPLVGKYGYFCRFCRFKGLQGRRFDA